MMRHLVRLLLTRPVTSPFETAAAQIALRHGVPGTFFIDSFFPDIECLFIDIIRRHNPLTPRHPPRFDDV
jgi:hypothetical protein